MNYTIRKARPSDIDDIIRLCGEHAAYEKASYSPEGKAAPLSHHLFGDHPRLFCLIAETPAGIVGYATYMLEFATWDAAFYVHMDCLFLREEARGYGIGEALVDQIKTAAREKHCSHMQWQTPVFNERAIRFYHRIGASSKKKLRLYLNL